MGLTYKIILACTALSVLFGSSSVCATKYAGEAFTLGGGARPLGFGGAFTAIADDPSGIYYNPAGLALVRSDELILLHSETFGSLLNHDFIAYSHPVRIGLKTGSLGIGIYRLAGGGIKLTAWDPLTGRPYVTREVSHYDYLLMIGTGINIGSHWRIGTTAKVILRSLGDDSGYGLGLDFGLQYDPFTDASLALAVSNITSSYLSYDNGTRESILPAVKLGINLHHNFSQLLVRFVADGEMLFEGRKSSAQLWINDFSFDTRFGGEIGYYDLIFFRAGSDIDRLTLGVGLKFDRFSLDGALMDSDDLDNSYRVSLKVAF